MLLKILIRSSPQNRDKILDCGVMHQIKEILQNSNQKRHISECTKIISEICNAETISVFDRVKEIFPVLESIVMKQKDPEILTNTISALDSLFDDIEADAEALCNTNFLKSLLGLLRYFNFYYFQLNQ